MNKWKLACVALIGLIAASCTTYEYIQPNTESGRYCVNQCLSTKQMCESNCINQKSNCSTNQSLDSIANALDKDKKKNKNDTSSKCNFEHNVCQSNCEENYKPCFTNCGGQIVKKKQ